MKRPSLPCLKNFVDKRLTLRNYLRRPGDGRQHPHAAAALLWSLLAGQVLRQFSFHGVEARRALGVVRRFADDTLAYFTQRLDPQPCARPWLRFCGRPSATKPSLIPV